MAADPGYERMIARLMELALVLLPRHLPPGRLGSEDARAALGLAVYEATMILGSLEFAGPAPVTTPDGVRTGAHVGFSMSTGEWSITTASGGPLPDNVLPLLRR